MAILPIQRFGNPVLREKSKRVTTVSKSIQKLIDDMIETMQNAYGAGLAAPQVGRLLRIIIIEIPDEKLFALINPEIVKKSGERVVTEGCLSFPGYRGEIKRAESVTCKALDRNGKAIRIKANDLLAQSLEHEIDHLNGVLYVDHLESEDKLEKVETPEYPME
ncbi:MAG: peptide deformylase [Chloroflexi bacterium]|nr:peptide deformylase [Chloroflexota bacterium]